MRQNKFYVLGIVVIAAMAMLACPNPANAQRAVKVPPPMRSQQPVAPIKDIAPKQNATANAAVAASRWTPLNNQPFFLVDGASNPILLTDGSVLVQDTAFPDWWKLTPDSTGSYVNGTWTQVASLPNTYSPLYHSSAVLPDGRLIIEGGEYLLNVAQTEIIPTWSAQGSIYDPVADVWTPVATPTFFGGFGPFPQTIGDAQSVILPNGTYMQADCCTKDQALLDATTLTWTRTGKNKFDINDEEGWNLLPNGEVLTVDAYVFKYEKNGTHSEIFNPATGAWKSAGSTIVQLWDSARDCGGFNVSTSEVGPAVLRPDGTVFYTGANSCGPGNTAIYNSLTGAWTVGPTFPDDLDIADGPAALEPNGKVLMAASPFFGPPGVEFFEWDGTNLAQVAGTPNAPFEPSYTLNFLVLPTGQILQTDFSNDVEIYTPGGTYEKAWTPKITSVPTFIGRGHTYELSGILLNGLSQGAFYGDDVQAATNYPLVRLTNVNTHDVIYARTHDHSSMAVASPDVVSTHFDVPLGAEPGYNTLVVVANGIPSAPMTVLIY
ncbi:MAG: hypothetical protein WCD49_14860 [Candidatus Acidiferrales bacterium]